jgi:hypothetical protein
MTLTNRVRSEFEKKSRLRLLKKSNSNLIFAGSVLVSRREQLLL